MRFDGVMECVVAYLLWAYVVWCMCMWHLHGVWCMLHGVCCLCMWCGFRIDRSRALEVCSGMRSQLLRYYK